MSAQIPSGSTTGTRITVPRALAAMFGGDLITPDHARYDEARSLYNGMHDKRPALIARCTSVADVQAALAYARAERLVVAVRGGGHSTPGYSSCDGGVVIDVGRMKSVEIDVAGRRGRFGAGLTLGEFDAATQEHGLTVTVGRVTHTGLAGLTLGSGSGWLERKLGPTCASLISAEVVTADGNVVRASETENAELLWGLKGGGGNFGVVTEFELRLHPLGPIVYAGMILHPRSAAPELLRFYRDFIEEAPDEICGAVALITAPPEDFVPEDARLKPACGMIVLYAGDPAKGEEALRPLVEYGEPLVKMVQPMPYTAVQQMLDPSHAWGQREYARVDFLEALPDEAIDAMIASAGATPSPFTEVILCPQGGAMARLDRQAMAGAFPDAPWLYFCLSQWWDPSVNEPNIAWARSFTETMRPWSVGKAPPNFIAADEGSARLRASYGDEKYERLVALKDKYDPDNVFALNLNIAPSKTTG